MTVEQLLEQGRFIDLSVTVSSNLPAVWPGNPAMKMETFNWYDDPQPYYNRLLTIDEHVGTHWDAPAHFIEGAEENGLMTTANVALEKLVVSAVVVDATDLLHASTNGISAKVTREHLQNWEREQGELEPGEGLLLRTGWSDQYYLPFPEGMRFAEKVISGEQPPWPGLDLEAMTYVADRGIALFGTDTPSAGPWDNVAAVHRAGLSRDIVFVENLTNLGQLPPRGALFAFLPIKIEGGSGAPGRAIAILFDTQPNC